MKRPILLLLTLMVALALPRGITLASDSDKPLLVPPLAPFLNSPADGALLNDNTPSFDWTDSVGAEKYNIEIDDSPTFTSPLVINVSNLNASAYTSPILADGQYWWHVRARNAANEWSSFSASRTFTIDATAPATPTLLTPVDGANVPTSRPVFDWTDSVGATLYQIQLDDNSDFSSINWGSSPTASTAQPETPRSNGTYYWRVRARDAANNWSAWSGSFTITIFAVPPVPPTLESPANGGVVTTPTPSFNWADDPYAQQYEFVIDNEPSFTNPTVVSTFKTSSSAGPVYLPDGTYYWRVRTQNTGFSWGPWAVAFQFTVDTSQVTLQSPTNGQAINDPTPFFNWTNPVGAADNYELQIDDNNDFSSPLPSEFSPTSDHTLVASLSDGTYYWRIRAHMVSNNAWGTWSTPFSFIVDTVAPSAPTLLSPANGSLTVDTTPGFDWSDVAGAAKYRIQIDNDPGFGSNEVDQLTNASGTTAPALGEGTYYWRVYTRDLAGNWSLPTTAWSFTVDTTPPAVPTPTAPDDGAVETTTRTPTFSWNSIVDATLYQFQLDNDSNFSSLVVGINTTSPSVTLTSPLANGTYYWRVRARDAAGNWSNWMTARSIIINVP